MSRVWDNELRDWRECTLLRRNGALALVEYEDTGDQDWVDGNDVKEED